MPPFDSALFSQALLHLADSPSSRSDMEKKGKARVIERYMMKKNMASALDQLAPDRSSKMPSRITDLAFSWLDFRSLVKLPVCQTKFLPNRSVLLQTPGEIQCAA